MAAFVRRAAESARQSWRQWQHVEPRFYRDSEISDEALRVYSLVLFGGPAENRVTRRLVEKEGLPLAIARNAVTIAGQKFPVTDGAVAMVYPHPMNEARYVVVCAGTSQAGMFFTDRLPDEYDFAVMDGRRVGWGSDVPLEKGCVAAGFFGPDWRYRESGVMRGDPEVRAKAGLRKAPKHISAAAVKVKRLALSELLETYAEGSFKHMRRDANWQGKPITLAGRTFLSGIGVAVWHEPCLARYDLAGGQWKRLKATVGIEIEKPDKLGDLQKQNTRVFFTVRGDAKELRRSPTFRWDSGPAELDVDISGVRVLELEVGNETTWHCAASSVDWADVRLEK
jgi:hypothetical protein